MPPVAFHRCKAHSKLSKLDLCFLRDVLTSPSDLDVLLVFYGCDDVSLEQDTDGGYFTMSLFRIHVSFFSFFFQKSVLNCHKWMGENCERCISA